ncbi:MAG: carbon-nitrogen hydrolase family protein [Candidatus Bathyarchaeota archaeon]|nr:carbon-nitrogen hydrolase family protein [Candidatus Bathyarchaeota archaeon]
MVEEITIALAQFPCRIGNKKYNMKRMAEFIKRARKKNAGIVVFPEMSLTGYTTRDLSYELAEEIPGASTGEIERIARKEGLYIIHGMPERSSTGKTILYNTAVLTGPEGYIGKYRKLYLPTHSVFEEKRYYRVGYQTPIFETNFGKLGMMICYDMFFPEVGRVLRLQGAKLLVCISASLIARRTLFETLTMARAIENTCFVAYANLVGFENGFQFSGGSHLIGPSGSLIAKAKYDIEDLVFGNINYEDLTSVETFVPTIRDLRPELYTSLQDLSRNL